MPKNVRQTIAQLTTQFESTQNMLIGIRTTLNNLRDQLGMSLMSHSFEELEEDEDDDDEDDDDEEEDLENPPGKPCWIIKERCPDGVTGTAHYFYDDDEQAWTGMKREAYRFGSEKAAVKTAKQLHRNGSYHFNEHLKSPGGKEGHNFDIVKIYAKD